ncbi:putative serine/threonine-protein kinase PBL7 [Primulina tabacum]|uniref:putative serine/threonine-protein kinase PBL7 n=1 Tax=Primulina tabacum TaxID=48773 RepID=UPI003F598270
MNVCNGSLNWHLSNKSRDLTWERRMTIACGAAKGLELLHRESIYGSMRPSNILLTHDYKTLRSCYGLAMNKYKDLRQYSESLVLKTFEHLAPVYGKSGIDLIKADVFSFGVVLLELITGRKSLEDTDGESFWRWGRPLLRQKKYKELIDPMLQDSVDVFQLYWMVHVIDNALAGIPTIDIYLFAIWKSTTTVFISSGDEPNRTLNEKWEEEENFEPNVKVATILVDKLSDDQPQNKAIYMEVRRNFVG